MNVATPGSDVLGSALAIRGGAPEAVAAIVDRMRGRLADRDPLDRIEARRNDTTRETYTADLERFLRFAAEELGFDLAADFDAGRGLVGLVELAAQADPDNGGRLLLEDLAAGWRDAMREGGLAPNTTNRRLTAVRQALAGLDRIGGLPSGFAFERFRVRNRRSETVRDTTGPRAETVARLIHSTASERDPRARRDALIVAMLGILGLRRAEALSIRLGDIQAEPDSIVFRAETKGAEQRQPIPAPMGFGLLLAPWLDAYRLAAAEQGIELDDASPLFPGIDRAGTLATKALDGRSVARMLQSRGRRAGLTGQDLDRLRPHALRHEAITTAAGHARTSIELAAFARHKDPRVSARYLDRKAELALELASRVFGDLIPQAGAAVA